MTRLFELLFRVGAIAWCAAIVAPGLAAAHAFPTLRAMPMTIEAYAGYDEEPHGQLAAGHVLAPLFGTAEHVQVVAAIMVLVGAAGDRRPGAARLRFTIVVVAAILLGGHLLALSPRMTALLEIKRQMAMAGDLPKASVATEQFAGLHRWSERAQGAMLLLLLAAVAADAFRAREAPR